MEIVVDANKVLFSKEKELELKEYYKEDRYTTQKELTKNGLSGEEKDDLIKKLENINLSMDMLDYLVNNKKELSYGLLKVIEEDRLNSLGHLLNMRYFIDKLVEFREEEYLLMTLLTKEGLTLNENEDLTKKIEYNRVSQDMALFIMDYKEKVDQYIKEKRERGFYDSFGWYDDYYEDWNS